MQSELYFSLQSSIRDLFVTLNKGMKFILWYSDSPSILLYSNIVSRELEFDISDAMAIGFNFQKIILSVFKSFKHALMTLLSFELAIVDLVL